MSEQKGVQGRAWLGMHSTESLCVTVYVVKVDLLIMYSIVLTRDFTPLLSNLTPCSSLSTNFASLSAATPKLHCKKSRLTVYLVGLHLNCYQVFYTCHLPKSTISAQVVLVFVFYSFTKNQIKSKIKNTQSRQKMFPITL